jgi:hypothetical protein
MRSLARALGVPPMTIYGYVPNKETLDGLVVDRLLADVPMPAPSADTWDRRLHTLLCDVRATLAERLPLVAANATLGPGTLQLLEHGAYGHEASRLSNGVHDLLREGGLSSADVDTCFTVLFTYVTGHTEPDVEPRTSKARRSANPTRERSTFAIGLTALIEGLKLVLGSSPTEASPVATNPRPRR